MPTLDFTLVMSVRDEGGYRLEVTDSPVGLSAAEINANLDPEAILAEVGRALDQEDRSRGGARGPVLHPFDPERFSDLRRQLGVPLFERLFVAAVGRAFFRSLDLLELQLSEGEDCTLRLRLQFGRPSERSPWDDPKLARDLARLASIPWEYLCHPELGNFLALQGTIAIVRRIDTRRINTFRPVNPPIRVLVVSCQPTNCRRLDLPEERHEIAKSLELSDAFEPEFLIDPDLAAVEKRMETFKPHILHFMGHGSFWQEKGEGHLCFVGPDGRAERVTARQIGERLGRFRTLRLAVLNACRSGEIQREESSEAFSATATALLAQGVPAVLAMQFPIYDDAALEFSRAFYGALPAQESIETAVWMGRRAVDEISWEFGTPALYLQGQDGHLFATKRATPAQRDDRPEGIRLAVQSFKGFGRKHAENCDAVLDLTGLFDGRRVRKPESWNSAILRRLVRFLSRQVKEDLPLDLIVNAHQSVAFALGYLLEAKAGIETSFYQRGQAGIEKREWRWGDGTVPAGDLWRPFEPQLRDSEVDDLALAISVTQPTLTKVQEYLTTSGLAVHALYHAEVPLPAQDSVESGAHAARLAQTLHNSFYGRESRLRRGTLHLFGAAPNAFFFFLGRLAIPWGRIQLYEFDFRGNGDQTYSPSILLDPATLPRVGSREGIRFLFT